MLDKKPMFSKKKERSNVKLSHLLTELPLRVRDVQKLIFSTYTVENLLNCRGYLKTSAVPVHKKCRMKRGAKFF